MSEDLVKKKIREMLRPRNIVKNVVGHSTRFVITTAVVKLIQPEKTADKVRTTVGGYVIGSMVAEHTESFALRKFDGAKAEMIEAASQTPENTDTPTI